MASHLASLWRRDFLELGNGLFNRFHVTSGMWFHQAEVWHFLASGIHGCHSYSELQNLLQEMVFHFQQYGVQQTSAHRWHCLPQQRNKHPQVYQHWGLLRWDSSRKSASWIQRWRLYWIRGKHRRRLDELVSNHQDHHWRGGAARCLK